ncbi:hypothetical protein ACET3Z_009573 [Daucus carota]
MGKEWLYPWGGGRGGSGSGSSSGRSRRRGDSGSVVSNSTSSSSSTPSGCINAVIHLFDFHPFHFSSHLHHQSHDDSTSFMPDENNTSVPLKGSEAPRNSLDIHDGTNYMEAATLSSANLKKEGTLHVETDMQIKTSGHARSSFRRDDDNSTICSDSPGGTKTPTLVARLMGLDLLPDSYSPRVSSSSSTINHSLQNIVLNKKKAARSSFSNASDLISHSVPVTPRISSSSSARRSDIDQRFSLQINKENIDVGSCQELEFSRFLKSKINAARMHEDENMSPGHYAKQIVKQFKESVSRRVGKDITNTSNHDYQRRDQNVVLLKPKKPSNLGNGSETTTKSPRLRLSETKSRPTLTKVHQDSQHSPKLLSSQLCADKQSKNETVSLRSKPQKAVLILREEKEKQKSSVKKSKLVVHGDENMKCSSKFKKPPQTWDLMRNKQEEAFVRSAALTNARASQTSDNKCKKTPLPDLLSLKKKELKRQKKFCDSEASDPPSAKTNTKLLSCNLSQSCQQDLNDQNSLMAAEQLTDYISRILNCTGIFPFTPISIFKFNSLLHPLHPSVFHQLPKLPNGKLVFELVDQLLAGILQSHFGERFMFGDELKCYTQCTKLEHTGKVPLGREQLLNTLFNKIKNFRPVNCLVQEDIDALIDKDLPRKLLECEEEVERMVMEIEDYILERLVHETVTVC